MRKTTKLLTGMKRLRRSRGRNVLPRSKPRQKLKTMPTMLLLLQLKSVADLSRRKTLMTTQKQRHLRRRRPGVEPRRLSTRKRAMRMELPHPRRSGARRLPSRLRSPWSLRNPKMLKKRKKRPSQNAAARRLLLMARPRCPRNG